MNKAQYDKKITKLIENRELFTTTLEDLIKSDKKSLINNENVVDLIKDDIDRILAYTIDKCGTIEYLYSFDSIKELINQNIINYLSHFRFYEISNLVKHYKFEFNLLDKINDDFENFIECVGLGTVIIMYYRDSNFILTDENKKILNEKIKNDKDSLSRIFFIDGEEDNKDYDDVIDVISKLISELLKEANLEYTDIVYAGEGSFAKAFIIGDKVLKLGKTRNTYNIPNDKRILKPLIRVNLRDYSNIDGTIEVSNKVDTRVFLSDDVLYKLYKELRDRGIIFTDIRVENLGYLIKSNDFNWSKPLADVNKARGLGNEKVEVLDSGSLVIIDTDFIYKEGTTSNINYLNCKRFEQRYKKEMEDTDSKREEYEKMLDELDENLNLEMNNNLIDKKTSKMS